MISIIVCTYNRDYILKDCLESLLNQSVDKNMYEIIVVNNNSTDKTQEIAENYAKENANFRVVVESQQGLSYARNRGFREAKFDWVFYMDDDAKASPDMIQEALKMISEYDYVVVSGAIKPWYRNSVKPKWLSDKFGESTFYDESIGRLRTGKLQGGCSLFLKRVLESIGGFPLHLGMAGNKIAYGEETYVQNKLEEFGYKLGYNQDLYIEHLVPEYKQTMWWHICSKYAVARDTFQIWPNEDYLKGYYRFIKAIKSMIIVSLRSLKQFLIRQDYYWQNLYIDVVGNMATWLGLRKGCIIYKKKNEHII